MKPYLTLTAAGPAGSSGTPVKPKVLYALLNAPMISLTERLRKLSDAASDLVNADLDHYALLDLLAQYRKAVSVLEPKLNDQLVGLMLPPNRQDVAFYDQCSELYARLAAVCKRIILSTPEQFGQSGAERGLVSQACYWAILFLGERLRCAYCTYTRAPAETWYEIHQIYRYAAGKQAENSVVRVNEESKIRNVMHVYKRVLLLGICDPYNFPFRCVHRVFRALDSWARLALLTSNATTKSTCLFHVNSDVDRPAMPILPNAVLSGKPDAVYLDTSALVSFLNEELNNSHHQPRQNKQAREQIDAELETTEMLKKLIVSWGIHPIRESDRKPRQGKCEVFIGMHSVASLHPKADKMDLEGIYIRKRLELIDESDTGARVQVSDDDKMHVRVGELVAVRTQDSADAWSTGMIRWAQADAGDKFYAGIYKFTSNVLPVLARHTSLAKYDSISDPFIGLWMMRKKGNYKVASLIVEKKYYKPAGTIKVERGGVRHSLEIRDVLLSTRCFIWFDLALPDTTPEHSASLITPAIA